MRSGSIALGAFILLLALRAFSAAVAPLTADEAYLWLLGMRWEPANFDGPGGIPFLAFLLDPPGSDGSFLALRMLSPLSGLLASAGLWFLTRRIIPDGSTITPWIAVAAWNALPFVNSASLVLSPTLPFAATWIWFVLFAWRAVDAESNRRSSLMEWALAGLCAALASQISYAAWLIPAAMACLLISRPILAKSVGLWLALALPIIAFLGPLLWNWQNGWISFAGQTPELLLGFGGTRSADALQKWLLDAGLLTGPLLLGSAAWCALRLRHSLSSRLLAPFLLPAALGFATSLWNGLPAASSLWLPASLVAIPFLLREIGRPKTSRPAISWVAAFAFLLAGIQSAALLGRLLPLPTAQHSTEPAWHELAARLRRCAFIYQAAGEAPLFLISQNRDAAAALAYTLLQSPDHSALHAGFPPVFLPESQNLSNQFGLWRRYDEFTEGAAAPPAQGEAFTEQQGINLFLGRHALYLSREAPADLPQPIRNGFARVLPLEKILLPDGTWFLYLCEDYQSAPL